VVMYGNLPLSAYVFYIQKAKLNSINSLSAMDGCDRPLKNQLHSTVVSCQIFIRSRSLIACCEHAITSACQLLLAIFTKLASLMT
jgi:hypothetical protein